MSPEQNEIIDDDGQDWELHAESDVGAFGMIPLWLLEKQPSSRAIHVYCVLAAKFLDRATNRCWPSRKTIGDIMGVSPATVDRGIEELVELGVLVVRGRVREDGGRTSNTYHVRLAKPKGDDLPPQICRGDKPNLAKGSPKSDEAEPESVIQNQRTISLSEEEIPLPKKTNLTRAFERQMMTEFARLQDFGASWAFVLNSNYLKSRPDKQAYVRDQLKRQLKREQGYASSSKNGYSPATAGAMTTKPAPPASLEHPAMALMDQRLRLEQQAGRR